MAIYLVGIDIDFTASKVDLQLDFVVGKVV